jgi:hypothetical protein
MNSLIQLPFFVIPQNSLFLRAEASCEGKLKYLAKNAHLCGIRFGFFQHNKHKSVFTESPCP